MPQNLVTPATTDAEKEAIYRLRYQVYIEEMGGGLRHPEADQEARQLRDDLDARGHHFMGLQDGQLAACARMNLRRDGPFECEEELELARFGRAFPNGISMSSRLVVHPQLRGSRLLMELTCAMYQFGREQGLQFDFIDCHPRLLPLYSRLGYRIYRAGFKHPKYVYVIPMVLVGDDLAHFDRVKSPLLPLARRFPQSGEGRDLLFQAFPQTVHTYVTADQDTATFWNLLRSRLLDPSATVQHPEILEGLSEDEIQSLLANGHIVSSHAGDAVFSKGDSGREIYVILQGSFQVRQPDPEGDPSRWRLIKILVAGDVFGEVAFLTEGIRHVSVTTMEESVLLVLSSRALDRLTTTAPVVAAKLFRNLARIEATRLRDTVGF